MHCFAWFLFVFVLVECLNSACWTFPPVGVLHRSCTSTSSPYPANWQMYLQLSSSACRGGLTCRLHVPDQSFSWASFVMPRSPGSPRKFGVCRARRLRFDSGRLAERSGRTGVSPSPPGCPPVVQRNHKRFRWLSIVHPPAQLSRDGRVLHYATILTREPHEKNCPDLLRAVWYIYTFFWATKIEVSKTFPSNTEGCSVSQNCFR